jgi:hypothetical protein
VQRTVAEQDGVLLCPLRINGHFPRENRCRNSPSGPPAPEPILRPPAARVNDKSPRRQNATGGSLPLSHSAPLLAVRPAQERLGHHALGPKP